MPRFRRFAINSACFLIVCAFLPGAAGAQGLASGAIAGSIEPGATLGVAATNVETGLERVTSSGRDGTFTLSNLAPGSYLLRIGSAQSQQMVTVEAANTTELRAKVVGSLVAISLASEPDGAAGGAELNVEDHLLTDRGLQTQQAGAVIDGISAEQALEGAPAGAGSLRYVEPADDADSAERNTGPSHGLGRGRHAGISYLYAEGSVREFRIGTNGYSAQLGSAGGVLASVTRQGGEAFHGGAFLHLRSDILAARDPLALATSYADGVVTSGVEKPHDLRENFGATLGGPVVWLPKVRYFVAAEGQRRGFPAISSPSDPLFYQLTSVQKALLGTRGVGSAATGAALTYLSSLTGKTDRRSDEDLEFGRLDWLLRPQLVTGLEYNRARWSSPAGLLEAPVVARGRASLGNAAGNVDQVLARVDSALTRSTSQELQVALSRDLQYERPQSPLPQEPAVGPGGSAPEVNIGPNGLLFGTPASLSRVAYPDERRFELREIVTIQRGRHLVHAGGSYSRVDERVATLPNAAGTFRYDSGAGGGRAGGLVDFITDYTFNVNAYPNGGCPSIAAADHLFCFRSFSESFGQTRVSFATSNWSAFVEDSWRPVPGLKLHAGLRYEYTALPRPSLPNTHLDALFGARAATGFFPEDGNNLGPRIAAAFEPLGRGRGVLRVGYGIFFGRVPGATIAAALSDTGLQAATTRIRIRPSTITSCPQAPANGFGYPCSFTTEPDGVVAGTQSVVVFDRRFRLPVVQQGSATLERQLGRLTTLSVEAVWNEDRQLPTSTDMNIAASSGVRRFQLQGGTGAVGVRDGETFVVPVYTGRITSQFGPVTDVVSNVNATYNGLVVRVAARPARGLQVNARYTWSKALDFGQAGSATPRTNGQFDPFANGYDKGLSSLNYPRAFESTANWAPRLEAGGRLRVLTNGWAVSEMTALRSGRPYSLDISGGTYLPGGHESINGSGGALYLPTVGRNTLRLPAIMTTNLRVSRGFTIRHGLQGQAVVEAFNVFNHTSVSSVNQRAYLVGQAEDGFTPLVFQDAAHIAAEGLNTTPFGTRTGTGYDLSRERQVQLSVKASF